MNKADEIAIIFRREVLLARRYPVASRAAAVGMPRTLALAVWWIVLFFAATLAVGVHRVRTTHVVQATVAHRTPQATWHRYELYPIGTPLPKTYGYGESIEIIAVSDTCEICFDRVLGRIVSPRDPLIIETRESIGSKPVVDLVEQTSDHATLWQLLLSKARAED